MEGKGRNVYQDFHLFVCLHFRFGVPWSKQFGVLTFTRGFDIGFKSLDLDLTFAFMIPFRVFSCIGMARALTDGHKHIFIICHDRSIVCFRVFVSMCYMPNRDGISYTKRSTPYFFFVFLQPVGLVRLNGLKNCLTQYYFSRTHSNTSIYFTNAVHTSDHWVCFASHFPEDMWASTHTHTVWFFDEKRKTVETKNAMICTLAFVKQSTRLFSIHSSVCLLHITYRLSV